MTTKRTGLTAGYLHLSLSRLGAVQALDAAVVEVAPAVTTGQSGQQGEYPVRDFLSLLTLMLNVDVADVKGFWQT